MAKFMKQLGEVSCSPDKCKFAPIAGLDINIDGEVWSGSDYEEHLKKEH